MSSHFIALICLLHTPRQLTCHQKRCPVHFTPSSLRDALKSNVKRWTLPSKTCFDAPSAQTPIIETEKLKSMIERLNSQQKSTVTAFTHHFTAISQQLFRANFKHGRAFLCHRLLWVLIINTESTSILRQDTWELSTYPIVFCKKSDPLMQLSQRMSIFYSNAACTNFSRAAKGVRYSRPTLSAASSPL